MLLATTPSPINGVVLALVAVISSDNDKTGPGVHFYVVPLSRRYSVVSRLKRGKGRRITKGKRKGQWRPGKAILGRPTKAALAICGYCIHLLANTCYVKFFQAPRSVQAALWRGSYDKPKHIARILRALATLPWRLGAAGDPAMVEYERWVQLFSAFKPETWTGYTHQRKEDWFDTRLKRWLMASTDSPEDTAQAIEEGFRPFEVRVPGTEPSKGTVDCLSAKGRQCLVDCGLCSGSEKNPTAIGASIPAHGAMAKFFNPSWHKPTAQAKEISP